MALSVVVTRLPQKRHSRRRTTFFSWWRVQMTQSLPRPHALQVMPRSISGVPSVGGSVVNHALDWFDGEPLACL